MSRYHKTPPFPDEEIGSIALRACREVGLSPTDFAHWYLNEARGQTLWSIKNLLVPLADLTDRTPRQLLMEHTLVPYGAATLPVPIARRLAIDLICGRTLDTSPILGRIAKRWCDTCIRRDLENFGETYWHRAHLLPGVSTCHLHGNALLHLPGTLRSAPIHDGVTPWIRTDLPQDLAGIPLSIPATPSLLLQISQWSARALKGRRTLPLAELHVSQLRHIFGPALLRYAGCGSRPNGEAPLTTARIFSIVAMRYLQKSQAGSQLELLF